MLQRFFAVLRNAEKNHTKKWLCSRGLFYEDTLNETKNVVIALGRLPADVRADRERRKVRAIECDTKNTRLPEDAQNYDPYVSYGLRDKVLEVEQEMAEQQRYI